MYTVYTMKNGFFRDAVISKKSRWHQSVGALNLDYLPMARRIPLRLFPPVHFNSRYLRRKSVVHRPTPVKVASPSTGLPGPLHAWLWGDESTAKWRSIKDISMDFCETELFADYSDGKIPARKLKMFRRVGSEKLNHWRSMDSSSMIL